MEELGMGKNLSDLRKEMDDVNLEILAMINKRATLLKDIAELKDSSEMEYFDVERELKMLELIINSNEGPLYNNLVKDVFSTIFSTSLKFMGINREKKLLVSSSSKNEFATIQQMFGLEEGMPMIIGGPCAVEKMEYLEELGKFFNQRGLVFLRAGAYKPRTSPYEFQGLKLEGLKMLKEVAKKYNLFVISEVVDTRDVEQALEYVDIIQIGARNMHNFELLKEVGQQNKPVMLKRGMSATINEFIHAAEYIAIQGNRNIVLCERGIRTYETKTRNTLDISAIPIIKKETNLPIIADLSHSLGRKDITNSVAAAVLAVGADGIMVEVHPIPELALSDSHQQLNLSEFDELLKYINYKKG
jgi:3-deoxy-7-phosphoheptulonate synthase/chorismate mutase